MCIGVLLLHNNSEVLRWRRVSGEDLNVLIHMGDCSSGLLVCIVVMPPLLNVVTSVDVIYR